MNLRQHISTHLQRLFSALLPGGFWQIGRSLAESCFPADRVVVKAMTVQAKRHRDIVRGKRNA